MPNPCIISGGRISPLFYALRSCAARWSSRTSDSRWQSIADRLLYPRCTTAATETSVDTVSSGPVVATVGLMAGLQVDRRKLLASHLPADRGFAVMRRKTASSSVGRDQSEVLSLPNERVSHYPGSGSILASSF